MCELIPISKTEFTCKNDELKAISNYGIRHGLKLLRRAYNDRFRAEVWYGNGGCWFVFVDKKDWREPVPFLMKSYTQFYQKGSTAYIIYKDCCKKYNLQNRTTTRHYKKLQEVL